MDQSYIPLEQLPFSNFDYFLYLVEQSDLQTIKKLCSGNRQFAEFCKSTQIQKIVEFKRKEKTINFLKSINYDPNAIKIAIERNVGRDVLAALIIRNFRIDHKEYQDLFSSKDPIILNALLVRAQSGKGGSVEAIFNRLIEIGDYSKVRRDMDSGLKLSIGSTKILANRARKGDREAYKIIQDDRFDYESLIVYNFYDKDFAKWLVDNYKNKNISNHLEIINKTYTPGDAALLISSAPFQSLLTDNEKDILENKYAELLFEEEL